MSLCQCRKPDTSRGMSLATESRSILKLGAPLIIGQVSQMLLGVADTVMLGRLGVTELAVLTFTNALFYLPFVFGVGVLTAVSVLTSNARGGDESAAGRASCRNGLFIATALGVLLSLVFCCLTPLLKYFGQPAAVVDRSSAFYLIIMVSMTPALMSMALKNHADAMDRPWPPFWIFLGGVLLNILLNWVLIYGNLGSPVFGLEGAAWATLISRIVILFGMFWWLQRSSVLREWVPKRWLWKPDGTVIRRLFGIGFPASLQMVCEVAAFSAAGLLMGQFGEEAMAAHQIALMCAATAFMIPLGLSMALSVRVAEVSGRGQSERIRTIAISGWMLGAGWSLIAAIFFFVGGVWLASLFNDDARVVALAARILIVVGIFQLVDSLQVTSCAVLRGMHDTTIPAILAFISYWIFGIPVAILISRVLSWGAVGVWTGLALGLTLACLVLCARTWRMTVPKMRPGS